jgi:signal peptidase I
MLVNDQIAEALLDGGSACVVVHGKSMLPSLLPGDLVRIRQIDPNTLSVGDVVLFRLQSRYHLHRIREIRQSNGARLFSTRGDSMPQADPEVCENQILGKLTSVSRAEREISQVSQRPAWNRWLGAALSYSGPMSSLASRLLDEKSAWKRRNDPQQSRVGAVDSKHSV